MAELKDSGARRDFGTGAVRDVADGKGRADLLPLDIISQYMGDYTLSCIDTYCREGNLYALWCAYKNFYVTAGWDEYTALIEVSKQYEDGARKYGDDNWRKGIPVHCYIDSALRHYFKYCRGDKDEPHDRAVCWNLLGAIWTHENKPDLIDLPFAKGEAIE